ncbi:ATP-binding cassette sub-family G member 2 [Astathelohania contejeani]|uniref:ATP-binding cassette sub-family G member 2 n=1 Tax=Astathelohania contejeani TaxID=164912 RepID=A0ABQ7HYP2_9MICR|nr:ATP-binding cassette sub-family G member 2 [Thelohania contejeani]
MEDAIKFDNITYQAKNKIILKGINGQIRKNRLTAIMGPSGSGKTTFLKIISGRMKGKCIGRILYKNKLIKKSELKNMSAFVHQIDLLQPHLTVKECIQFSANLRSEEEGAVDKEIKELGLDHIKDSLIGDSFKGISGGERKRVAIAMELVSNPDLIFLDEPTSGLDSLGAQKLINYLQGMKKDKTVVATIHQPSTELFFLFDDLLLIKDGVVVYNGETKDVMSYFMKFGYEFPQFSNPADHIFTFILPTFDVNKINSKYGEIINVLNNEKKKKIKCKTGLVNQIMVLFNRDVKGIMRNKMKGLARVLQSLFISLIIGVIFFDIPNKEKHVHHKNVAGYLHFLCLDMVFNASIGCANSIFADRDIMHREYQSNYYYFKSYFLSKVAFDSLFNMIHPLLLTTVSYFLTLNNYSVKKFILLEITLFLTEGLGHALGLLVSSISSNVDIALYILPSVILPLAIVNGMMVDPDTLILPLRLMQYISPTRYAYNIVIKNHYDNKPVGDPSVDNIITGFCSIPTSFSLMLAMYFITMLSAFIILRHKTHSIL